MMTPEAPPVQEAKRYQRQKLTVEIIELVLGLAYLVIMAAGLSQPLARAIQTVAPGRWGLLPLYAAALLGLSELLLLPLQFYSGFVLEHRYGLSNQTLAGWLWKLVKGYLLGLALGLPLVMGLYAVLWWSGRWWWLIAAAGWLGVTVLMGQLAPVLLLPLFYKTVPLDDPTLLDRLERIARGTGLKLQGVFRLNLSKETKKANAALAGLGASRRVLLGDTLLADFSPEEIEVVFAHEVGHHVYNHIWKMIAVNTLVTGFAFWLCDRLLGWLAPRLGYASFRAVAAMPLLLIVLSLFGLLMMPAQNVLSRRFERVCDRYALRRTGLTQAYVSAFRKLGALNKSDPKPHPVIVWLFHDHPPLAERIAMAGGSPELSDLESVR